MIERKCLIAVPAPGSKTGSSLPITTKDEADEQLPQRTRNASVGHAQIAGSFVRRRHPTMLNKPAMLVDTNVAATSYRLAERVRQPAEFERVRMVEAQAIAILFQDFAGGGTERTMVHLANEWSKTRTVRIICGTAHGPARSQLSAAVEVQETNPAVARSPLSRLRLAKLMRKHLVEFAPDIIVGPGNHTLPLLAGIGDIGIPTICKLSNPICSRTDSTLAQRAYVRATAYAARRLSAFVALSPALAIEAQRHLNAKYRVIADPIPTPELCRQGNCSGPQRLLFAGRLVEQKNVALILRAIALLPLGTELILAGDGPDRERLESLSIKLGISEQVRFVGHVRSIDPLLTKCDALLLSSRFEGYPAVLVQALAAGVPVVSTASSTAISEIMSHPSFGEIVAATPEAIARGSSLSKTLLSTKRQDELWPRCTKSKGVPSLGSVSRTRYAARDQLADLRVAT